MDYKMLCSDLDGTLLSTKSDVSDFTISEISRIKERLRVILVSARMPQAMHYLQKRLNIADQPISCYNGALVIDGERQLFSETIPFKAVEEVYRLADSESVKLGLYHGREWYVEETSERVEKEINYTRTEPVFRRTSTTLEDWKDRNLSAHKIMLMGTKGSADELFPLLITRLGDQMHAYRSNDTLIELAPNTVSKLSSIKMLLAADETLNDVICFGDNYNDMEMLKHSGMGVAVANAREEVKAIADHITLRNTDDGVAHFIRQYLI